MVMINEKLYLESIQISDQNKLLNLMMEIYPPVYRHLWIDHGKYFLQGLYSEANTKLELENPNSHYYFVNYKEQAVGILRIIENELVPELMNEPLVKLHRIYLSKKVHNKGIGKQILQWVENEFCKEKHIPLYLEVMDTQENAIGFYEHLGFAKRGRFNFNSNKMKIKYRGMFRMIKEYK